MYALVRNDNHKCFCLSRQRVNSGTDTVSSEQLLKTMGKVKRQINPKLEIEDILLTMADYRTNFSKGISTLLKENYGSRVRIFDQAIPMSVRAAEISAEGVSIYRHDPEGKAAAAYQSLTEEVLDDER